MKKEKTPIVIGIVLDPVGDNLVSCIWVAVCVTTVSSRLKTGSHAIGSLFGSSTSTYFGVGLLLSAVAEVSIAIRSLSAGRPVFSVLSFSTTVALRF